MLAAAYPGIPGNYLEWADEYKEAWIRCIPYSIAELNFLRSTVDSTRPEGLRKALMLRYDGDEEEVERLMKLVNTEQAVNRVKANPKMM